MAQKKKETAVVYRQTERAKDIYDMWIETNLAALAEPGQFIGVYPGDGSMVLPRPLSICEVNREAGRIRVVYRESGRGTAEFSQYTAGHPVSILGILGNGFPLEESRGKRAFLIGGGIGIPPMLELAKRLEGERQIILGYRNSDLFLLGDFEKYGTVSIATEDGSVGTKGNVLDTIREEKLEADVIYACGPMAMLRAVKQYAAQRQMKAFISLEEKMACGVGACLGCVCRTRDMDSHSHVNYARICTDGPVFEAQEVDI